MVKKMSHFLPAVTISPEMFSLSDTERETCIRITATNDNFVATHFIRDFEVRIMLTGGDLFSGRSSNTATATISIIEDGMTCT